MENISPKVEYKSSKFEQKSPRPPARHRRPLRRHSTIAQMPGVDQVKPLDYPAAQSQKNVFPVIPKSPEARNIKQRRNSVITWDPSSQVYVDTGLPPADQFDQFLYQSHHVGSPTVHCTPELILEIPSDTESGPNQSTGSLSLKKSFSKSPSPTAFPRMSPSKSHRPAFTNKSRSGRRASHTGEFISIGRVQAQPVENSAFLLPGRSRQHSLGDIGSQEESYTVRSFAFEGQRVVNKGDSVASRSRNSSIAGGSYTADPFDSCDSPPTPLSRENSFTRARKCSLLSSKNDSCRSSRDPSSPGSRHSSRRSPSCSPNSSFSLEGGGNVIRVLMLGASGVGKSSLCSQFLTSEHRKSKLKDNFEQPLQKEISVSLDDEETRVVFVDYHHGEMSVETQMSKHSPEAYVVVMAVDDKASLDQAERILAYLRMSGIMEQKSVILVANKTDLVRNRVIKPVEGKNIAVHYNIKYIETSPGINHNVDELLVGVLTQIRLRRKRGEQRKNSATKVKSFLGKILNFNADAMKSCTNFHTL